MGELKRVGLETPLKEVYGVGPKMAKRLEKLGLFSVCDLLYHFPNRYEDFSEIVPIAHLRPTSRGEKGVCVKGRVLEIKTERSPKKRLYLTFALISDETGSVQAIWFRQPYISRVLKKGEEAIFAGRLEYGSDGLFLVNPVYEKALGGMLHTGRIVPVYPETEGVTSKYLRRLVWSVLPSRREMVDFLPAQIRDREQLMELKEALLQIHFPESWQKMEKAKERLAFDELFLIQLKMLLLRTKWQKNRAPKIRFEVNWVQKLVAKLPFKLTNAQRRAAWEIICDLAGGKEGLKEDGKIETVPPMNRLLEGDVGSGKTVVAAIAILVVAHNHFQSVFLAPTEVLAIQHFRNLVKLFEGFQISVALLTQGKKELVQISASGSSIEKVEKADLVRLLKEGKVDLVIGTHALLEEEVFFKRLALAVIDEQHRFGVKQRAALCRKSETTPHLLSMSATPIPRTLSLALYGDLDLSILDEMPKGRQKVVTYLVPPNKRDGAYQFIRKQIKEGHQAFVICPLIEESDRLGVKAAKEEYERLKKEVFSDLRLGLLHGRMKSKEKEEVMGRFQRGELDILVSTAVVEVGVDVPNATVMMIEGAERFGLAQLHQFRGRVGRSEYQSYCLLFTETGSAAVVNRLKALMKIYDGFRLAEKDLEMRGPGELAGVRQHGFWDLRMASLRDAKMIERARRAAKMVLEKRLLSTALKERLEGMERE